MRPRRVMTLALVWICGLLLFAAGVRADDGAKQKRINLGKTYYMEFCATCHGLEGRGDGPDARYLDTPPTNLTRLSLDRGEFLAEEIEKFIDGRAEVRAHGTREMPIWGEALSPRLTNESEYADEMVTKSRLKAVVAYLETIQIKKKD